MTQCFVALGSNLDNPMAQVTRAIQEIDQQDGLLVTAVSSWYESPPLGPADQPNYINGVASLNCTLTPHELLLCLQGIENDHDRRREQHWGPRTLDLDILLYGNQVVDDPNLQIPHLQMHQRMFVLQPLHQLAPDLALPCGTQLASLLACCPGEKLPIAECDGTDRKAPG
jgi:2-amino-4-hydroxy-6-hydroxymethyldihydropteridine diphosphokinase